MSALGLLAGEMLLKFAGKKLQDKLGKKPDIKAAAKEVIPSLIDAPLSTLTGSTITMAAVIIGALDLSPEMTLQLNPYAQEVLTGIVGFIGVWVMTLKKKK